MVDCIDPHRDEHGVEPIGKELPMAPSTYRRCKALERQPEKRSERTRRDDQLGHDMQRVWQESDRNYEARKVWKPLGRESISAARCTVERLMKQLGLQALSTTATEAASISLSAIPNGWQRQASMPQLAA